MNKDLQLSSTSINANCQIGAKPPVKSQSPVLLKNGKIYEKVARRTKMIMRKSQQTRITSMMRKSRLAPMLSPQSNLQRSKNAALVIQGCNLPMIEKQP